MVRAQRLFFALRPPPAAGAALAELRDALDVGGRPLRDDLLHVTLLLLPDHDALPPGLIDRVRAVGAAFDGAPIRLSFDELIGGGGTLLVKPSEPPDHVMAFQARLAGLLARAGIVARAGWRFAPHVTLRRGTVAHLRQPAEPIGWRVEELALVLSHVGETRHEEMGRWALATG